MAYLVASFGLILFEILLLLLRIDAFLLFETPLPLQQRQQHQVNCCRSTSSRAPCRTTTTECLAAAATSPAEFNHALAILTMPYTSMDRIANEAILNTVLPTTNKLSIFLRCEGRTPSLASLRRYMGEVYSQLWDYCVVDEQDPELKDVVVYIQNIPNVAPESWIHIQRDLDCVCSHDSIIGWTSEAATGRGKRFQLHAGDGLGGLDEHVAALNRERRRRDLAPVYPLHVDPWPRGACPTASRDDLIVFLDDDHNDDEYYCDVDSSAASSAEIESSYLDDEIILSGAKLQSRELFESVACGGTFDGLHFGHRKLLTLATSCVSPITGRLLVGVTIDEMLQHKAYAKFIPDIHERIAGVRSFLHRLAPGIMNRVKVVPIADPFGPPGEADGRGMHFDALVLSHETLETGIQLNRHRVENLNLPPLHLLCTRRTEAYGMSSTTLRRLRSQKAKRTV